MTLNYRTLTTITAVGLGLALGWGLGMQPIDAQAPAAAPAKQNWKDQKEFDLYTAFTKATGKGKVEALDKWKQDYATSDFAFDREEAYLGTYQELGMTRQQFDKAVEILKTHPNHFFSIYAIETAMYQLMPAQPADLDTGERVSKYVLANLDAIFDPANMPKTGVLDTKPYTDERDRSWIFRTVGYGHSAEWWSEFISTLRMYGYDYVLSIEHEDSLMAPEEGLTKAAALLSQVVIKEKPAAAWWV